MDTTVMGRYHRYVLVASCSCSPSAEKNKNITNLKIYELSSINYSLTRDLLGLVETALATSMRRMQSTLFGIQVVHIV